MARLAMTFIEKLEDEAKKLKVIETMKDVCSKKIYLEVSDLGSWLDRVRSSTRGAA
jgi:hypothetical protein